MIIPLPPRNFQEGVGPQIGKQYLDIGKTFKYYFLNLCKIRPNFKILDVGCGSGRIARHLVNFIKPPGCYTGIDVRKPLVDWCTDNITSRYPHFNFLCYDIYNERYNSTGEIEACDFIFPFKDNYFNFIHLISVFTHMMNPIEVAHYIFECNRVLADDGKCFITMFLSDDDSKIVSYKYPAEPHHMVYYSKKYILSLLACNNLRLLQPIFTTDQGVLIVGR